MIPCEYAMWNVLPTVRRNLALEMAKKGLSQKKISNLLNTSEAAVSNYIKGKRGSKEVPKDIEKKILKSANKIIKGAEVKCEVCNLCKEFLKYEKHPSCE